MIHVCFISVRKHQEDEIGMLFATIKDDWIRTEKIHFKKRKK
jgi:hypothetical protein